jgi:Tol biopolymer transport system component
MCFLIGNVVMSSLLSALLMATSAVACSLILVAQVITFTSNVFISPIQPNQSAYGGTFPGRNGQIAFYSERDGNGNIYVMNAADGSNQTRLTNSTADDLPPSWSPDGTKIAFGSSRDGNWEIYIMNAADGSGQTRLTNNAADDSEPDWSPA